MLEAGKIELATSAEKGKNVLQDGVSEGKTAIVTGKRAQEKSSAESKTAIETGKRDFGETVTESKTATETGKRDLEETVMEGKTAIETGKRDPEEALQRIRNVNSLTNSEQKEDLRQRLATYYIKQLNSAPISSLLPDKDVRLDKFYVSPKIVEKDPRRVGARDKEREEKRTLVTSYRQIFCKCDKLQKTVLVVGEAGMGKSSCTAISALKWAKQVSSLNECTETDINTNRLSRCLQSFCCKSKHNVCSEQNVDAESQDIRGEDDNFTDDTFFKEIEFVFHLSLRDSSDLCSLSDMIRYQLINRIYQEDERATGYSTMLQILSKPKHKCLIIADGLDEWSHPDVTDCSCTEEEKAIPYLASNMDATVLITSRPWRMSQHRVMGTNIDKYLVIEGVADDDRLVQKLLNKLNETVTEKKTLLDFPRFTQSTKLDLLLSIPMILMLQVCLWFEGIPLSFSLCDVYANMMEMMFRRKLLPVHTVSQQEYIPLPRCFQHTEYVQKYYSIVMEMAQLAFTTLFSNKRASALVFNKVDFLAHDNLVFVLKTGILQETKAASLIRKSSSYSFIHKTVQEFLAAVYISCHPEEFQRVVAPFYKKYDDMSDVSQVFIFMCGLNIELANEMSTIMSQSVSINDNLHMTAPILDIQSTIVSGYKEAENNEILDIQLSLFTFDVSSNTRYISIVHALLRLNKSKVRHICADMSIGKEKLQEVFRSSKDTLTYVDTFNVHGQYDLSACNRLHHLSINGIETSDIVVDIKSLVSLRLVNVSEDVENKLMLSLGHGCENLKMLGLFLLNNTSSFCQALPLLTHLEILRIYACHLVDHELLLPASVNNVLLYDVTMSAQSLKGLVGRLKHCIHSVKCSIMLCTVEPTKEYEKIKRYIQRSKQFRVDDVSDIYLEFSKI